MNLVIFGPPGAGKGTQGDNLSKDYNLFKVSTGDLLRDQINKQTSLGKEIKQDVEQGSLVSDHIINNLIENLLLQEKYVNRLIFDGYPRTLNQAKNLQLSLKKFNQKILCVLSLKITKNIIIKRLMGRQVCSKCGLIFNKFFNPAKKENHPCGENFLKQRLDDTENVIERRYKNYIKLTMPIIEFYKDKNLLYEINGENEINTIYKEICSIISTLKG